MGGTYAGAITAALFLDEFVGEHALGAPRHRRHDAESDADDSWRSKGATGFGARLLARLILDYPDA